MQKLGTYRRLYDFQFASRSRRRRTQHVSYDYAEVDENCKMTCQKTSSSRPKRSERSGGTCFEVRGNLKLTDSAARHERAEEHQCPFAP